MAIGERKIENGEWKARFQDTGKIKINLTQRTQSPQRESKQW